MTETSSDHSLKSFRSASRVASDHRVRSHDGADRSVAGVHSVSNNLTTTKDHQYSSARKRKEGCLLTRKARSLAVKIPQRCSSSSTTRTQSVRLAAQS